MTNSKQAPAEVSPGWLGWIVFTGFVLCAAGVVNVLQGLVALLDDGFYRTATSVLAVDVSWAAWGWALLILGVALLAAGGGVILGYRWARVVGVVVACVNALVNLGFAGAYPAWTVLAVGFDLLAIYALVVHGAEAKTLRIARR